MSWKKYLDPARLRKSNRDSDARNEFESDYGRVLFSPALRRMHDKTQVFPLTADDNIHSRLTHSMEVMSIGYSLGISILKNKEFVESTHISQYELERYIPVILQSACLVHDIGNPPFGHFGETVIKDYFKKLFKEDIAQATKEGKNSLVDDVKPDSEIKFKLSDAEKEDFTQFDGNAQGLRILTKLQVLDDPFGLNLTFASLGSYIKYPNFESKNESILSKHKKGVFQSEIQYFKEIAQACGTFKDGYYIRHPLTFLMEAADSICYLIMDIEDGFNKKWYKFGDIKKIFNSSPDLISYIQELETKFAGPEFEVTKMVRLRIRIISILVKLATENFHKNIQDIYKGIYEKELIFDDNNGLACSLQKFCNERILPNREILSLEMTGYSVIEGLLNYFTTFLFHKDVKYRKKAQGMISNSIIRAAFLENEVNSFEELSDYYKLRIIVDYISGMTDQFALNEYQKLSGQKIS